MEKGRLWAGNGMAGLASDRLRAREGTHMKGQMSIFDWLDLEEPDDKEYQIKAPVTGWKTVTGAGNVLRWASERWKALVGVREDIRADYINTMLLQGISFSETELRTGVLREGHR